MRRGFWIRDRDLEFGDLVPHPPRGASTSPDRERGRRGLDIKFWVLYIC